MAKIYLVKNAVISPKQLKELGLSKESIAEIQKWRNGSFGFLPIIIVTDDDKSQPWFPFEPGEEVFKREYPEGIIWKG